MKKIMRRFFNEIKVFSTVIEKSLQGTLDNLIDKSRYEMLLFYEVLDSLA